MIKSLSLVALFALLTCPIVSPLAQAESGFVKLKSGHELYVDYQAPRPGKPTFVLVNGLVYDLGRWQDFARPLAEEGYGLLRYYFRGQLKTLRQELKHGRPEFFDRGLTPESFANELAELMDTLKINKGIVVGLSYGAGIAAAFGEAHPERVEKLIFLAPLVISLDRYDAQGNWIHQNLQAMRLFWGPLWGSYVYDQYYNWIYRHYLDQRLGENRVPAEMADVPDAYKEAIFHQVRAMRDFDLRQYRFEALANRVHLVLASREEAPALADQFRAWRNFREGASVTYLSPSSHAIPDDTGRLAAYLADQIASGSPRFTEGAAFYFKVEEGPRGLEQMNSVDELEERARPER